MAREYDVLQVVVLDDRHDVVDMLLLTGVRTTPLGDPAQRHRVDPMPVRTQGRGHLVPRPPPSHAPGTNTKFIMPGTVNHATDSSADEGSGLVDGVDQLDGAGHRAVGSEGLQEGPDG